MRTRLQFNDTVRASLVLLHLKKKKHNNKFSKLVRSFIFVVLVEIPKLRRCWIVGIFTWMKCNKGDDIIHIEIFGFFFLFLGKGTTMMYCIFLTLLPIAMNYIPLKMKTTIFSFALILTLTLTACFTFFFYRFWE